jgi:hypothetical protein
MCHDWALSDRLPPAHCTTALAQTTSPHSTNVLFIGIPLFSLVQGLLKEFSNCKTSQAVLTMRCSFPGNAMKTCQRARALYPKAPAFGTVDTPLYPLPTICGLTCAHRARDFRRGWELSLTFSSLHGSIRYGASIRTLCLVVNRQSSNFLLEGEAYTCHLENLWARSFEHLHCVHCSFCVCVTCSRDFAWLPTKKDNSVDLMYNRPSLANNF